MNKCLISINRLFDYLVFGIRYLYGKKKTQTIYIYIQHNAVYIIFSFVVNLHNLDDRKDIWLSGYLVFRYISLIIKYNDRWIIIV